MGLDRRNAIKVVAVGAVSVGAAVPVETRAGDSSASKDGKQDFTFAFITDAHMNWSMGQVRDRELPAEREDVVETPFVGYQRVLNEIKGRSVGFILTGGDGLELKTFDSVHGKPETLPGFFANVEETVGRMKEIESSVGVPVFNTLGNHDTFENPPATPGHPLYAQGLFRKYLGHEGKSYYSFDIKGWHFIVLSTHDRKSGRHWAGISDEQLAWLETDLEKTGKNTPVVVSAHVPFPHAGGAFVEDREKVARVLKGYNVKLMLFGHAHSYEEFEWNGIPCVVGSSLSGAVWSGARAVRDTTFGGTHAAHSQGYLILSVSGREITWKHYPFNFDAEKYHYETTGIKPYGVSMYWHLKQMGKK